MTNPPSGGMRTFSLMWIGQFASLFGSSLTAFVLGVWIFETTHSETLFGLNMVAYFIPQVVFSPLAGALVDRWNRRYAMMFSDLGAGLSSLGIAVLYLLGVLQPWHIYVATFINSAFNTIQWPAYSAATSMIVPKDQLGRAGGMVQMSDALVQFISPALAAWLYTRIGIGGVALIDFSTLLSAVLIVLAFVRLPDMPKPAEDAPKTSLWQESSFGWNYIRARPALLAVQLVFASGNFLGSLGQPLLTPMLIEMSSVEMSGIAQSVGAVGMIIGAAIMSAWGGPKRRVFGVVGASAAISFFIILIGLRPWLPLIILGLIGFSLCIPIINASNQALWQAKVEQAVQGRVFSVRRMIAWSLNPVATLIGSSMAEKVFNPAMQVGGSLANTFIGQIIGVGAGRGSGLIFVITGLAGILVSALALLYTPLRRVDLDLPDAVNAA
jgi:hypothetical protein